MIVSGVLASGLSQRALAEEHHSIEALIIDRPDESLGVGVQVVQEIPERLGALGIPINDEEPFLSEKPIERFGEVSPDLDQQLTATPQADSLGQK
jgi:hypothetical protein